MLSDLLWRSTMGMTCLGLAVFCAVLNIMLSSLVVLPIDQYPMHPDTPVTIVLAADTSPKISITNSSSPNKPVSLYHPSAPTIKLANKNFTNHPLLPQAVIDLAMGVPFAWHNVSLPKFDHNCSCLNPQSPQSCCARRLLKTHKMGFILSSELVGQGRVEGVQVRVQNKGTGGFLSVEEFLETERDFRTVFWQRNLYSTFISGYLYHKSGHECWVDNYGRPYKNGYQDKNRTGDRTFRTSPTLQTDGPTVNTCAMRLSRTDCGPISIGVCTSFTTIF